MAIRVTSEVLDRLIAEAASAHPDECCGILLGNASDSITTIRPARNVHPRSDTHFEIDPKALIDAHRAAREGGPLVVGYYHSHPSGPLEPSATDRAMAAGDGAIWAIVAENAVKLWIDAPGGFEALSYSLLDG